MYRTLVNLGKVCPVNPVFEPSLKHNLVNGYCRQSAWEPSTYLYPQENKAWYDWIREHLIKNDRGDWEWTLKETSDALYHKFMEIPLAEMQPKKQPDFRDAAQKAAQMIDILTI